MRSVERRGPISEVLSLEVEKVVWLGPRRAGSMVHAAYATFVSTRCGALTPYNVARGEERDWQGRKPWVHESEIPRAHRCPRCEGRLAGLARELRAIAESMEAISDAIQPRGRVLRKDARKLRDIADELNPRSE